MEKSSTKDQLLPLVVISVILLALRLSLLTSNVGKLAELHRVLEFTFSLVVNGGGVVAGIGEFDVHVAERDHSLLVLSRSVCHFFILVGLVVGGGLALALSLALLLVLALVGGSGGLDLVVFRQDLLDQLVEYSRALCDGSVLYEVIPSVLQSKRR